MKPAFCKQPIKKVENPRHQLKIIKSFFPNTSANSHIYSYLEQTVMQVRVGESYLVILYLVDNDVDFNICVIFIVIYQEIYFISFYYDKISNKISSVENLTLLSLKL